MMIYTLSSGSSAYIIYRKLLKNPMTTKHIIAFKHKTGKARGKKYVFLSACRLGNLNLAKKLYEDGYTDHHFLSKALEFASEYNRMYIVKYLLSIGAGKLYQAFASACKYGHLRIAKRICERSSDTNFLHRLAHNDQFSLLYNVSMNGHLHVLKWFSRIGIDLSECDNLVLDIAAEHGHHQVVQYLIKIGCDPTLNNNGAIRRAIAGNHWDTVKILLPYLPI